MLVPLVSLQKKKNIRYGRDYNFSIRAFCYINGLKSGLHRIKLLNSGEIWVIVPLDVLWILHPTVRNKTIRWIFES